MSGIKQKLSDAVFSAAGWAKRTLAANTFDKTSDRMFDIYESAAEEMDPEEVLDREFTKVHDGDGYRVKFK